MTVTADPDVRVGAPALVFKRTESSGGGVPSAFDVAPDGKHFLVYEFAGQAPDDRMTVTLNWFGELRPGRQPEEGRNEPSLPLTSFAHAPAAPTSSLPSVGRLFAPRTDGRGPLT